MLAAGHPALTSELQVIAEASWERNQDTYRYLGGRGEE
jgi:hypothetical protein